MRWALRLAFLASVDGLAVQLRLPAPGAGVALRRTPALVMQSDLSPQTNTDPVVSEGAALAAEFAAAVPAPVVDDDEECSVANTDLCVDIKTRTGGKAEHFFEKLGELQEGGAASILLIAVTALSLTLANNVRTSAWWLSLWGAHVGPAIGGHALSVRAWINEGLMSVFFFTVGLEIKHELRHGSLASIKAALLPCMAALGGMVTPMAVYAIAQLVMPGGSMGAIAVPMATDIAFALGVLGFFRTKMPAAATAFLLTLATVDDLGAILVLATCFAKNVAMPFLGAAAAITATLTAIGRSGSSDIKPFALGGVAMWWCLLRAGVAADIAGVVAALCISTNAIVPNTGETLSARMLRVLAPISAFLIMPLFALANTAMKIGGGAAAGAAAGGSAAATAAAATGGAMAAGVGLGLLIGKPLGIVGFSLLSQKLGLASLSKEMNLAHLGIVGLLGGIGFTMCLLLTEVAITGPTQALPKLAVLISSAAAAVIAAVAMKLLPEVGAADDDAAAAPAA